VYLVLAGLMFFLLLFLPARRLAAGWLPITLFLFFTFLSNLFNHHGRIFFGIGSFFVTDEGLTIASFRTLRLLLMIAGLKVLMSGTPTEALIASLGRIFGPLEKTGLPVKDFVHVLGLTLTCFPLLKDRAMELYRSQASSIKGLGLRQRIAFIAGFMLPLFVESIRNPETFFEGELNDVNPA
jgi:energy-coupling factor transporter transmembrane protein EcfT